MTRKILIIDDEKSILFLSKAILVSAGYTVFTESDSTRAYATVLLTKPDLILMDIVMPEINGIELARKIRENPELKSTHIFALTGMPMLTENNRVYFEKIILKPFHMDSLLAELKAFFAEQTVAV
ncbi:two-component system response regulator [Candidatus Termititenax persephonae]|uniref:Two-component system response regulator n=1 Tax=Candidatus Termititenax persephonae TaxID=2218525 RepID=A0A388TIP6_9BACT|nr:two-component system response regulator [Candidatus Termititenax persephonae]